MAVNDMTIEQAAVFLDAVQKQATGSESTVQSVNTGNFVSVAQSLLKMGHDPVLQAISAVLSRTIFAVRPYSQRFRGIDMDAQRWGNHVRKINYVDSDLDTTDDRYTLEDGQNYDHYVVKKPKVVQTNYYGQTAYSDHVTIFRDQLDVAMRGPEEFAAFISGVMQNMTDKMTQIREDEARATLINFMTGKVSADTPNVINVLQEYKNQTSVTITPENMYSEGFYVPFVKWLYAYINTLTDLMANRSDKFHVNLTDKAIKRHTPANRMKAYMSANALNRIDSSVLSAAFNEDKLKMIDFESVGFWQNINDPYTVMAKPTYLKADGTLETASTDVQINNVIGVLFDEDALGITTASTWMGETPMNQRGGYTNIWYHFTQRMFNDFTENGVVLYADTPQ